jgi:hypothetical protein
MILRILGELNPFISPSNKKLLFSTWTANPLRESHCDPLKQLYLPVEKALSGANVVSVTTHYRLDTPRFEPRWENLFYLLHTSPGWL